MVNGSEVWLTVETIRFVSYRIHEGDRPELIASAAQCTAATGNLIRELGKADTDYIRLKQVFTRGKNGRY